MHFGATLRLLRTSAGVSLTALASDVGVSPAYLSRVEHGHDAPPTPDRLRAIATALRLPADTLVDLVEELRPDAVSWLGKSAAGRHLAAELRRRRLGPAQIARVARFVQLEFPRPGEEGVLSSLDADRVLVGVEVGSLRDALEIASLRLPGSGLAAKLAVQEAASSGAVGGGLLLAYAAGEQRAACLLLLTKALAVTTPDGAPVRAVLVLVGPAGARATAITEAAQLADPELIERLACAGSGAEAVERMRAWVETRDAG